MKAITIRNIDEKLEKALKETRLKTGKSINTIILEAIKSTVLHEKKKNIYFNDLDYLAGTWTRDEEKEFLRNTSHFNHIEKGLWK